MFRRLQPKTQSLASIRLKRAELSRAKREALVANSTSLRPIRWKGGFRL